MGETVSKLSVGQVIEQLRRADRQGADVPADEFTLLDAKIAAALEETQRLKRQHSALPSAQGGGSTGRD